MNRYTAIPWPWIGLLLCVALLGQEALLAGFHAEPSLVQSGYRVFVITIGVVSIALLALPPRRIAYLLAFLVCVALMAWALWLQYHEGLDPCPLCIFQRVAVSAAGIIFLIGFIHSPGRTGAWIYAVLILIVAGAGAAFAGRQIWLQSLPKDQVPACGMGLNYMLDSLPLLDVIKKVFAGSGECAEKAWELFGLSIAGWTFVFFIAMIVGAIALTRRE
ncbi:MAG TPA: disulfide bond formation protein B [Casimicrobiaceae bacterium]|jgi:disulfide bond formation protein DsbB